MDAECTKLTAARAAHIVLFSVSSRNLNHLPTLPADTLRRREYWLRASAASSFTDLFCFGIASISLLFSLCLCVISAGRKHWQLGIVEPRSPTHSLCCTTLQCASGLPLVILIQRQLVQLLPKPRL
eukprot:m.200796 g.200796  ORF g.200796 m.200796 type:complete len:126 (+) comp10667_c1_seq1:205-582(+)